MSEDAGPRTSSTTSNAPDLRLSNTILTIGMGHEDSHDSSKPATPGLTNPNQTITSWIELLAVNTSSDWGQRYNQCVSLCHHPSFPFLQQVVCTSRHNGGSCGRRARQRFSTQEASSSSSNTLKMPVFQQRYQKELTRGKRWLVLGGYRDIFRQNDR